MKNIYFVQVNNSLSNAVYLPYAVGTIAAYAFSQEDIRKECCLQPFIFMQQPIDRVLNGLTDPFVMAFSCYMWNYEYNLALAEAVKTKFPACKIIFGGPQIPDDTSLLEQSAFIDFTIHGEGEIVFTDILRALLHKTDFSSVANIAFRTASGQIAKTERTAPCDLSFLPSPYAMGLFDYLLEDPQYKNRQFDAIIETNRGCPFGCIYCYWARSGSSFRTFPLERVKKDIEWLGKNKIPYCVCADGNFGILERDEEIVDHVIKTKQQTGYPEKFETTSAKNKDDFTFRINQKLERNGLNRGVSVAVQSMSPVVLDIIGRKNMSVNNLAEQLQKYRSHGIATYTDLILGLPGETLESFCRGLFAVFEAGQHDSVNINRCEVFPNTILHSEELKNKYKIRTRKSQLCQNHSKILAPGEKSSCSEIVIATSAMNEQEWKKALQVGSCAQSFHCLGLLRFIAVYLRKAKNISYYDFYMNLFSWIENHGTCSKRILDKVFRSIDPFLRGEGNLFCTDERFGALYWAFEEGIFLSVVSEANEFYEDIKEHLSSYFDDRTLFDDLLTWQVAMIAKPGMQPLAVTFRYDWKTYFENIFDAAVTDPVQQNIHLRILPPACGSDADFAREVVWFGRRSGRMINKTETE